MPILINSKADAPTTPLRITKTGEFIFGLPLTLVTNGSGSDDSGAIFSTNGVGVNNLSYSEQSASAVYPNRITSLSFDNLSTVLSNVSLSSMLVIQSLSFPVLTSVGAAFSPTSMAALLTMSAPKLAIVAAFNPTSMASLTALNFPELKAVGTSFSPASMAALVTMSFPSLEIIGTSFSPTSMASLTALNFPELKAVGTSFSPASMAALVTMSFPSLERIGAAFSLSSMASLTTLNLPSMVSYGIFAGASITVPSASVPNVTTATFGTVGTTKSIAGNIILSGIKLDQASVNGILALLVSLDGTNGTTLWGAGRTITINGGTNAAPSGQGITDAATLVSRGATVTTN